MIQAVLVGTKVVGAKSMEEMVGKLKKPRRVMMLVKAGSAVDAFIDKLIPLLEKGDIIIDGGNSEYTDSIVRTCYQCYSVNFIFLVLCSVAVRLLQKKGFCLLEVV